MSKKPPLHVVTSKSAIDRPKVGQLDFFREFYGHSEELSNTIELWDAVPIYTVPLKMQSQLREKNRGRLGLYQRSFLYKPMQRSGEPISVSVEITPALIEVEPGVECDFYPSETEELIQEALKKIFCEQQMGVHEYNSQGSKSWVFFTIRALRCELAARGHTRSFAEIRRSLEIMARSSISIKAETKDKELRRKLNYTGNILNDLTRVSRSDWIGDPKEMCKARWPSLISDSIDKMTYRQFNYGTLMGLEQPLSRWLFKRMAHYFTNAEITRSYHLLHSSVDRDSRLLHHTRLVRQIERVAGALEELRLGNVILNYEVERRYDGRALADALYTVIPHPKFVAEQKAANKRQGDHLRLVHG